MHLHWSEACDPSHTNAMLPNLSFEPIGVRQHFGEKFGCRYHQT